jgi:hypothetical protein
LLVIGLVLAGVVAAVAILALCRSTGRIDQGLGDRDPRRLDRSEPAPQSRARAKME